MFDEGSLTEGQLPQALIDALADGEIETTWKAIPLGWRGKVEARLRELSSPGEIVTFDGSDPEVARDRARRVLLSLQNHGLLSRPRRTR